MQILVQTSCHQLPQSDFKIMALISLVSLHVLFGHSLGLHFPRLSKRKIEDDFNAHRLNLPIYYSW